MAVALIALFVAMGGVGYAAVKIGSKQIVDNSVRSKDIRNGTLRKGDLNPKTVTALRGQKGPAGSAGSARAYGYVTGAGVVDLARSKGITATRLATGIYCVNAPGVSNTSRVPVATVARDSDTGTQRNIQHLSGAKSPPGCPNGWAFLTKIEPNTNSNTPFSIVIP